MIWKLVFHIDEADKWPLLLGNIKNFLNGIGDQSYDINIVANAGAVTCISENGSQIIKEIQLLKQQPMQELIVKLINTPSVLAQLLTQHTESAPSIPSQQDASL